jgi:hypothetical protein
MSLAKKWKEKEKWQTPGLKSCRQGLGLEKWGTKIESKWKKKPTSIMK